MGSALELITKGLGHEDNSDGNITRGSGLAEKWGPSLGAPA